MLHKNLCNQKINSIDAKIFGFFNNVTNGPKSHNDLLSFHDYHSNEKFTSNHKLIYNFAVCCLLFIGN